MLKLYFCIGIHCETVTVSHNLNGWPVVLSIFYFHIYYIQGDLNIELPILLLTFSTIDLPDYYIILKENSYLQKLQVYNILF